METALPLFEQTIEAPHKSAAAARVEQLLADRRGMANPMPLRTIQAITHYSERVVKGAVEELIMDHGLQIGASRNADSHGYFLIETEADLAATILPYQAQVRSMIRRMRALQGDGKVRAWLRDTMESF